MVAAKMSLVENRLYAMDGNFVELVAVLSRIIPECKVDEDGVDRDPIV